MAQRTGIARLANWSFVRDEGRDISNIIAVPVDCGYAPTVPSTANWIILAILALVLLSPLSEVFDQSDALTQDGSDFAVYIICLFGFLAYGLAHVSGIIATFAVLELQTLVHFTRKGQIDSRSTSKQERNLFLSCHSLRI